MTAEQHYQKAIALLKQDQPDETHARQLLRQAATAGHKEAAFQLAGLMLVDPSHRPELYEEAIELLKQAARAGHPYARYNLLQLQEADGRSAELLEYLYHELAENGLVHAQVRLMHYYQQRGDEKALYWANQAAEQNHPEGHYHLAQHYQTSAQPNQQKAHQHYQAAAEQGFALADWQLGLQYQYGQGVVADTQKATAYYQRAAEANLVPAQAALGELLLEHDTTAALKWLNIAADNQASSAHALLAKLYLTGEHTERNHPLALQHAQAAGNHPDALQLLGDIYRYGLGITADPEVANRHYQKAAQLGSLIAQEKLLANSALQADGNYQQAKQTAVQKQQAEQAYQTAQAYHFGLGQPQDYTRAIEAYQTAAAYQHSRAQTNLGMMYYQGQGVDTNLQQAAHWFQQAAEQGDPIAQYNLACLNYHGQGMPRSLEQACQWLEKAISNHSEAAALEALLQKWQSER